jgi:hypothetical protein
MPTTSTTDRLARATEELVEILQQPHPATPLLKQGTIVNDAMKQLTKISSLPPNRNETAMAAPSPRVLETDTSAPRVDENNNNNNNQPPRVVETTTAIDRLRNRLATKSVHNSERPRQTRTNSVQLQSIIEENLPHTDTYHRYYS